MAKDNTAKLQKEIDSLKRQLNQMHADGMKIVSQQQQRIGKLEKRAKQGDKINSAYKKKIASLESQIKKLKKHNH
jgi:hypothetical protein